MPVTNAPSGTTGAVKGSVALGPTGISVEDAPDAVAAAISQVPYDYNVVVVILDDVGLEKFNSYVGITGYSGQVIRIHNIRTHVQDRGVTFNNFWANPTCGPTRAGISSEMWPHHHGLFTNITENPGVESGNFYLGQDPLDKQNRVPQLIQCLPTAIRNGRPNRVYRNAKIGKSHTAQLDNYDWCTRGEGWDIFKGHQMNLSDQFVNWQYITNVRDVDTDEIIITADLITEYGPARELTDMTEFLDDAAAADRSFFLWWAPSVGHAVYQSPPTTGVGAISALSVADWTTAFGEAYPAAGTNHNYPNSADPTEIAKRVMCQKHCIESADEVFGRVVSVLQANGQYTKTIFIVLTDNGTSGDCVEAPFAVDRAKRFVYRGGVNCPLFIGGAICGEAPRISNAFVCTPDIGKLIRDICKVYPAGADANLLNGERPKDSVGIIGHLRDKTVPTQRTLLYSMNGGQYAGYGWDPATRRYVSSPSQLNAAVSDGVHSFVRQGGTTVTEKLFLHASNAGNGYSGFRQPESANLLAGAPSSATLAVAAALRAQMNAILAV